MKRTDELVAFLREVLGPYFLGQDTWQASGTWSPVLAGSGVAGTLTLDATLTGGEYVRLGNRVLIVGHVRITAIVVAPTLDLRITGLPFPAASPAFGIAGGASFTIWQGITLPAGYTQLMLRLVAGVSYLNMTRGGSNAAQANVQGGELVLVGGAANFEFIGQYLI